MPTYHITINRIVEGQFIEKELSCATGKGSPRPFKFKIEKNAVEIEYEMSKVYSLDKIIAKSDVFREALTKAYLYHALLLNSALKIQRLIICIGDRKHHIDNDSNVSFPFVFSMLTANDLQLSEEFRLLPDYIVANSIKYNQKELRFVSLASYLSAKSKPYQIERFNALWTSINALYNYVGLCYEQRIVADCRDISRIDIQKNLKMYGEDRDAISALMYHLKNGCKKPPRKTEATIKSNHKEKFQKLASLFQKLSDSEITELYDLCLADLHTEGISHTLPDKYKPLDDVAALYQFPSYVFMLLQYAYSLRCELFHGNKSTPIIYSYNDRCIGELRVVNYFLNAFLTHEIPLLYTTDYYGNMHNDLVSLMNSGLLDPSGKQNKYNDFINEHQ